MKKLSYVLGLDLGTGSLKGVLINNKGEIVHIETSEYELHNPRSGYNEQIPEDWIQACKNIFAQFSKNINDFNEQLEGISFSGQMHSLVLTDNEGKSLRPAILWNDTRNTSQCRYIMDDFGKELFKITKNIALEGFTLPKILWVKENEPEIWNRVKKIFLPKDYLRYHLTGEFHMDYSDAAGTLLMDTTKREWSSTILEKYNIPKEYLPKLVNSTDFIGYLKYDLKETFNFKNDIKIFAGGADNAVSSLGAGLIDTDTAIASFGTSGVFLSLEDMNHEKYQGKVHLFNHVLPNKYYSMGVTLAAGHSLTWFKNLFNKELSFDELLNNLSEVPIGSEGLLFTPYISGERTPHVDSQIRGSFIGLSNNHNLDNLTRAVVEGITFSLKDSQVLMESLRNKKIKKIISLGGGSKNSEWLQIQADIFDAQIIKLESEEGPGLGAAMIAAMGLQWYDTLENCVEQIILYEETIKPIKENVIKYDNIYKQYKKIYGSTKDILNEINN